MNAFWEIAIAVVVSVPVKTNDDVPSIGDRSGNHGDQKFPGCHDIPGLNLYIRRSECFFGLGNGNKLGRYEDKTEQQCARNDEQAQEDELCKAVEEFAECHEGVHLCDIYLMVSQAKRPELAVVDNHFLLEFDNTRISFVTFVTLYKTAIQLYDPWERELCAFGIVETTNRLDDLLRTSASVE
jgi:hypothetical protein